jgi:hypothetical protein
LGIPGNEIVDEEAKVALKDILLATKKYPPQDLINRIKQKTRKQKKPDGKIAKTL